MHCYYRKNLFFFIFFIGVVSLWGCSGLSSRLAKAHAEDLKNQLTQQVTTFLQAMVDKRWSVAYGFFDSGYKNKVPEALFAGLPRKTELKAFSVESIDILPSGEEATVIVSEDISERGVTFKGVKKTQHWFIENDNWVLRQGPPTSLPNPQK